MRAFRHRVTKEIEIRRFSNNSLIEKFTEVRKLYRIDNPI